MAERNAKGQFTGGIFNYDSLTPNLKRLLPAIDAAVDLVFDSMEPVAETKMRNGATWTDRTGNARNGLMAKHDANPMVDHTLTLYHSMPYGFWLEVRWSGKYAIIGPVMLEIGPEITKRITAAIPIAIARLPG
jgi:hypothetical protein